MKKLRDKINPTEYWEEKESGHKEFQAYSFAERIAEVYRFATTVESDVMYHHTGRVWARTGEQLLRQEIRAILRDAANRGIVNEVVRNVKHLTRKRRTEMFDLPPEKLVVKNGVVDLTTGGFTPLEQYSGKPGAQTFLDVKYDPEAFPHNFNQFLHDVLPADDVPIMWELIGYCLYRGYPFQKAALFLGEGANGKSTLVNALREFLSDDNISNVELQDLANDRFAAADLDGKLANLASEISADELENTSKFKELTGEDMIRAQRKYEDSFKFENQATLIFSTNQPPAADDDTYAYERRWLYFTFPNTFTGTEAVPQRDLLDRFRKEHSGILNLAIEAFKQLWARGGFEETTYERQHEMAHDRATNPAVQFAQDKLARNGEGYLRIADAEEAFRTWCESKGRPKQGREAFVRAVRQVHEAPEKGKDPADGRYDVWRGLELVDRESPGGTQVRIVPN